MGRAASGHKNHKEPIADDKIKDKYKTDPISRPKYTDFIRQAYNTTPGDKHSPNKHPSPQFQYLKNNLCIKSCIGGNCEVLRFQVKKVTIRNYTPKILNQEINMGMWM